MSFAAIKEEDFMMSVRYILFIDIFRYILFVSYFYILFIAFYSRWIILLPLSTFFTVSLTIEIIFWTLWIIFIFIFRKLKAVDLLKDFPQQACLLSWWWVHHSLIDSKYFFSFPNLIVKYSSFWMGCQESLTHNSLKWKT